ncbi:uncharacterized protein LOC122380845 isoform X2 [Amphibalanus amphitrite]|uniref:uncharacterized protein LOC122380845 isoform X2 n=1 Tax=Amphibalanus amphitrite TaxID=1232801 RepID=UPI001C90331E|nr:uncharacterized protein LOC122380845 isoform X2 [Amphibalanus amphitrite]
MSADRGGRRGRRRGQTLHAAVNHCCYRDEQLGPQVFLCSQFHEVENGTASSPVVGGAYCCRPSRDWAFCCNKAEFERGVANGNDPSPQCGRLHAGRRFHRRFMVPRVALTVGSILVLLIIAIFIYFCFKKRLLAKKRENRIHGWIVPNGMSRQDSAMVVGVPGAQGDLITPYQQATGVYTLPASNHPVQYIGGSQCPLREYGPLQPAYPGRPLPGVTEVR